MKAFEIEEVSALALERAIRARLVLETGPDSLFVSSPFEVKPSDDARASVNWTVDMQGVPEDTRNSITVAAANVATRLRLQRWPLN